jgi:hypothetical protein
MTQTLKNSYEVEDLTKKQVVQSKNNLEVEDILSLRHKKQPESIIEDLQKLKIRNYLQL